MALKDWRQNTSGRVLTEFENIKTGQLLEIIKYSFRNGYQIVTDKNNRHLKDVKNKSAALKFAKSYMRTH